MKEIQAFQTADGAIHLTQRAAKTHAETRYANALTKHAHKLVQISKYSDFCAYLDREAESLAGLVALRADCELTTGE